MITSIQSSTTFLQECTLCFSSVHPMGQLITKPVDQGCDIDVLGFFYVSVHWRFVSYQYAESAVLNPGKIVLKISLKLTPYSVQSVKTIEINIFMHICVSHLSFKCKCEGQGISRRKLFLLFSSPMHISYINSYNRLYNILKTEKNRCVTRLG